MRYFTFEINTIVFKATLNIHSNTLKDAKRKLEILVFDPSMWDVLNETTVLKIPKKEGG